MRKQTTVLLPLKEDLRAALESRGVTHLVSEGFLIDYPVIMDIVKMDLDPKSSFILPLNVFPPESGQNEPDRVNYSLVSLTEPRIGYPIDSSRLKEMHQLKGCMKFYVFLHEYSNLSYL